MTDSQLLDLLASQHRGVLVTLRRDGRPQLSNVDYSYDATASGRGSDWPSARRTAAARTCRRSRQPPRWAPRWTAAGLEHRGPATIPGGPGSPPPRPAAAAPDRPGTSTGRSSPR